MLKDLDITPDDPAELRAVNRLLAGEVKALSLKVAQLQHQRHGAIGIALVPNQKVLISSISICARTPRLLRPLKTRQNSPPRRRRELIQSRSANTAASPCRIIWIGKTRSSLPAMNAVVVVATCAP